MHFGVCYYPEHWPRERWPSDAALMREAGLTYVRIAEFAWQRLEPAEGDFRWDWLDAAVETLAAAGLRVILGTPTAAPPAWLTRAHPDILPVDAQGRVRDFGSRRHYCFNSPSYQQHTARIVTALAERYGQHPAIAGWQIDNEFGCNDTTRCYCPRCAAAFHRWLAARYGTLDALNAAWGNVFWSQTYDDWEQIALPNQTVAQPNPSHVLDAYRFASDAVVAYQQLQVDILRPRIAPEQFLTHNLLGNDPTLDGVALARPLDFICWDSYPTGYREFQADSRDPGALYAPDDAQTAWAYDAGDPHITGFCHTLTRGFKQQPFWVMEQQVGQVNWSRYNTGVRAGIPRLWTWHAAAHGADTVVYFRWRACRYAQEQYHSGLLRHDGSFDIGYDDLLTLQGEHATLDALTAEPPAAEVALLMAYDDLWALQIQPQHREYGYMRALFRFYRALQALGIPADIVPAEVDLSRYRLVIAPALHLVDAALVATLTAYVGGGGTLLLGPRSGFKDRHNIVTDQPLPGLLRPLVGATVSAWRALPPGVTYGLRADLSRLEGDAALWAEALAVSAPDAQILAEYVGGPFDGYAALTTRAQGAGSTLYLGWYPSYAQAQTLLAYLARERSIERLAELPEGLVAARRSGITVLFNFTESPLTAIVQGKPITVPGLDLYKM